MKITCQEKELLESETFLSPGLGEIEISIGRENDYIKVILEFINTEEKEHNFEFVPIDNTSFKILLSNWNNSLGISFVEPVEVGTLFSRKLYILLLSRKLGSSGDIREITFSSYLGEEVQNG